MTGWEFLRNLHEVCHFQTREGKRVGRASSSELKRWVQNRALIINGVPAAWDREVPSPMVSAVLFPKNPVTLL
jgi:hypothetical protein